ncbi:organelle RRM domain-containing protein 1, chloroplastic [Primulina huaijiensis]|uniref:organelle RRM domain-containing protein 1, chloroplastic n=1 Tax=Primulina huaijiensis TaxID=1492673 RepID=UPI003CC79710
MEAVSCSAAVTAASSFPVVSAKPRKIPHPKSPALHLKATSHCSPISCFSSPVSAAATSTSSTALFPNSSHGDGRRHWMVLLGTPPPEFTARPQVIDYYVNVLEGVLGCKEDAQRCMYDASSDAHFGFCCDIDEESANELAGRPEVLLVKPDPNFDSVQKDYSSLNNGFRNQSTYFYGNASLFPAGTTKHWLVRMGRPAVGGIRKAPVVDYYTQVLMRVLGNEKDAQMCMYHVSWQSNYGFCCELDNECAQELAGIPGVLSVQPDESFGSDDKDYNGESCAMNDSSASSLTTNIKTKKLFVTGLSFYTSEKTLGEAFGSFGELVEVKVIMDKISKRSKGYAFVEYTTEEAASTALREMNGKIINGWMITVDVSKKSPLKYSPGNLRPAS